MTSSARLLRRLTDSVPVEYSAIHLDGTGDVEIGHDEYDASFYDVDLRIEAWDGEPPGPGESWEVLRRLTFVADTGVIGVQLPEAAAREFVIGPPLFEYGLAAYADASNPTLWLLRVWPIRDAFDPLVHMRPREPGGLAPLPVPRPVTAPVTEAGWWAAMRPDKSHGWGNADWPLARLEVPIESMFGPLAVFPCDPVSDALNPDHALTFQVPLELGDLRDKEPGCTFRAWRWEPDTPDGRPEDGHLLTDRTVHVRDAVGRRVLVSGIVTALGESAGSVKVRDAEPHEAARVLCAEEVWQA
ncbi:hypothetical protein [Herbidospora sp. RD11066]